jgi:hypothetical protein
MEGRNRRRKEGQRLEKSESARGHRVSMDSGSTKTVAERVEKTHK